MWRRLRLAVVMAVVSPLLLVAQQQAGRGTITGIVADPTGAAVPAAKVTALRIETGIKTSVTASATGDYTISFLPVGTYSLSVEASGFKTYEQTGIALSTGAILTINVSLELGTSVQKVEVTAQGPLLEASSTELGTTVTSTEYSSLPLAVGGARRNPLTFILLAPGVTGDTFSTQINGGQSFSKETWVNGAPTSLMELQGDVRTIQDSMSVDAVKEFTLVTNDPGADMGRGSGVVSITLKGGTNSLHGSVYEFLRNTAADTRGFFAPTVQKDIHSEFGANVGGPVVIPKLYNGRDRTFFFFDFNGYRHHFGAPGGLATVPTEQMVNGDFSAPGLPPIYDPLTTCGQYGNPPCALNADGSPIITRQQFSGNIIPPGRFSTVSKNFLPLVPAPDLPGFVNNFRDVQAGANPHYTQNSYTVRIDHRVSDRQNITWSGVYGANNQTIPTQNGLPTPLAAVATRPEPQAQIRLSDTFSLRNTLVNNFTFGFNYTDFGSIDPYAGVDWPGKLGLKGVSLFNKRMPVVNFETDGFSSWANWLDGYHYVPHSYVYEDQLQWMRGRHSMSFGVDIRYLGENINEESTAGTFDFTNLATALPGAPSTGNSFSSFLLGDPLDGSLILNAAGVFGDRVHYMAFYGQDRFKVSSKLTLNYGLRWEVPYSVTEVQNKLTSLDPNLPNPGAGNIMGALAYAGFGPGRCNCRRFTNTDYKEFGPQFGLAYQVDSKTVFRGGYGIYYSGGSVFGGGSLNQGSWQRPIGFEAVPTYTSPDGGYTAPFNWDNGFPQNFTLPPVIDPTFANGTSTFWDVRELDRAPQYQNWTANLQREITPNLLLSAAYAGSKGTRLPMGGMYNPNQTPSKYLPLGTLLGSSINSPEVQAAIAAGRIPGPPYPGFAGTVSQSLRPFPQYLSVYVNNPLLGNSTYHSFQFQARKRLSQGLDFIVSYTASKTLDNSGSSVWGFGTMPERDNGNLRLEKSLSVNDIPQNLAVSYVYELPFGPDKKFLIWHGVGGKVVGGWQVSGMNLYHKGVPLSLAVNNTLDIFSGYNTPNRLPGVSPRSSASLSSLNVFGVPASYINPAAFTDPAPFTIGNGPRNYGDLRQPAYYNEDFALTKRTYFHEKANVEFRWEMFNMFNRHIFNVGGTNVDDPGTLGQVYSQVQTGWFLVPLSGARLMQFSLRINW